MPQKWFYASFFVNQYDELVSETNLRVTACISDAAAGAGSDQAERSQPNCAGSNWPEEKAANGLSR